MELIQNCSKLTFSTEMDTPLAQFYTEDTFSKLLVESLETKSPGTILDLGVGHGSLVRAAYDRWGRTTDFVCADIDKKNVKKINNEFPFIKVYHANGLKMDIEKSISLKKETVDIAVCNPPYQFVKQKESFTELFFQSKLDNCLQLKKITSDIVFLAQNIKMLRKKGELGIILPDSVLTGKDFAPFRRALLSTYKLRALIELPSGIFSKTEAKTHIVYLRKEASDNKKVPLYISGKDGKCFNQIEVDPDHLQERMDYSFHSYRLANPRSKKRLADFSCRLIRGNVTHKDIKNVKSNFIHSTSFLNGATIAVQKFRFYTKYVMAEPGDLIIVRVGRGCVGKVAIVKHGSLPITDCIYVLKGPQDLIRTVFGFLSSADGRKWVTANAHGVCSKVLSREDIFNIPVSIS